MPDASDYAYSCTTYCTDILKINLQYNVYFFVLARTLFLNSFCYVNGSNFHGRISIQVIISKRQAVLSLRLVLDP